MAEGFRTALLKISGEALAGDQGYGIDPEATRMVASEIAEPVRQGRQVGAVIGGGNILRGANASSVGVPELVADQMGMMATVINAMALRSALHSMGIKASVMCAFPVGNFVEVFRREIAQERLSRGEVTIFAGGTGNPCFTTDSAAALRAVEIEANVMVKGTQVDGVYDKDPKKEPDASRFERISPQDVLNKRLKVIDAACIEILGRKGIPVIVLDIHKAGNIGKALAGQQVGTIIA